MLQSQLNDQQALERQAEQQLAATRQGLESALQALALSLPAEGTEAAWLHARESEFAQWQAQQTQHDAHSAANRCSAATAGDAADQRRDRG